MSLHAEVDQFEEHRGRLAAIAYRMLGSAVDAEDVVQEVYLRWHAARRERIETPAAWLTKVLTNLCLNQLNSARARRETYVGQWLPEPVPAGDRMLGPADTVEQRESVSLAVLTLLERLSPKERAVYVLREVFEYPHREIADILDLSEANCQQLFRRAKQHVGTGRTRVQVDPAAARKVVEEFLAAGRSGDPGSLIRLLTDDAVSLADGGDGAIKARRTPVVGAASVARYLRGLLRPNKALRALVPAQPSFYATVVNNVPALIIELGGQLAGVLCLDWTTAGAAGIQIQLAPDKLAYFARRWPDDVEAYPLHIEW